jgi:hypothetical protein
VRTVESHLYHAMGKLGARRREELDTQLDGSGEGTTERAAL